MLNLHPMQPKHLAEVAELQVAPEQIKFVGCIEDIMVNIDNFIHPHVMLFNDTVVGFFLIDTTYSAQYPFAAPGSLGLRAFFVSEPFQGQGFGKQAVQLLSIYLPAHYPQYDTIYLTVNCKNPAAKRCYELGGFRDTGELYLGGDAGPQQIMILNFPLNRRD